MASLILPGTKIGDFSGNLVKGDGQSTALWTSDNIDEEYTVEYKGQLNDHVETMKSTTTEDGEQFAYRPFSKKKSLSRG